MTMTLEPSQSRSRRRASPAAGSATTSPSRQLQRNFAAVRVSFTWLGVRKNLNTQQKAQAAESFGAEGSFLSAGKKLLDTRDPAFQAVSSVRSQIVSYWKALSLPYPEPGMRLIKQEDIEKFNQKLNQFRDELALAVTNLDAHFESLKSAAQERLGSLFNPADYPPTLIGMFAVEWDFPSVEPPEYLLRLNPELYEQERQRMSARFDEAVKLAEETFIAEFSKLVGHLSDRLTVGEDGQKKVFRDSAITNLSEFFARFKNLNVRSNAELDKLVETAQQVMAGADANAVRDSDTLRQRITSQLAAVRSGLDQMLVEQPRRRILRSVSPDQAGEVAS